MANILLWVGIALILIGQLALAWQASKRLAMKDELSKSPQTRQTMRQKRNYCLLITGAGMVALLIALIF